VLLVSLLPFFSHGQLWVPIGFALAAWVLTSHLTSLYERLRNRVRLGGGVLADLTGGHSRSYYGMLVAHLGVAVLIIGLTMVSNFAIEKDLRLSPGSQTEAAGFRFLFEGTRKVQGPNYSAQQGRIIVFEGDRQIAVLLPEKRTYLASSQTMTEAAINAGLLRDVYVSLGEPLGNGDWSLRIYYKPYVRWIWLGCLLMACGGILAITDRRYRTATRAVKVPQGVAPAKA
jgi:cytochrome c-type biogenesis protein CcmF